MTSMVRMIIRSPRVNVSLFHTGGGRIARCTGDRDQKKPPANAAECRAFPFGGHG